MLRRAGFFWRALTIVTSVALGLGLATQLAGAVVVKPLVVKSGPTTGAGHPMTLAHRRTQVKQDLTAKASSGGGQTTHSDLRILSRKRLTPQKVRALETQARARRSAGHAATGKAAPEAGPQRAAATASTPNGPDAFNGGFVLAGAAGPLEWYYLNSFPPAGEWAVPELPGYTSLPETGTSESTMYPGEPLSVLSSWYGYDTTNTPIDVTVTVACQGTMTTYDAGQVSAPPVSSHGQGAISDFQLPAPIPGSAACASFASEPSLDGFFWVQEAGTAVGDSTGQGTLELYSNDINFPGGEFAGCPVAGNSAALRLAGGVCGDPVDTASGSFGDSFTDASLHSPGYPLSVTRDYSSAVTAAGPLGTGWTMPWSASLTVQSSGDVTFNAENGSQYDFASNGDGTFTSPPGATSVLAEGSSGTYTLTTLQHNVLTFTATGQLSQEDDATGRGLTFSYDSSGELTSISDAAGQDVTFVYDGKLLHRVTLPNGSAVAYGYTNDQLSSVTDPDGKITSYAYNGAGLLESAKDPDGNYTFRNTYNASGQVTAQEDGSGNSTSFSYTTTSDGLHETDATDPDGGVSTHLYGGNMLLAAYDPLGHETVYGYDPLLEQVQVINPLGDTTTMSYDSAGDLMTETDALGNEQQWTYDSGHDVLSYTDADGNKTSYTYNAMDEVTSTTTAAGEETTNSYDGDGNLTATVDPRGNAAGGNAAAYTTSDAYDRSGLLTSVTNPDGDKTSYTYDAMGFPLVVTDPEGNPTTYVYDADERQTSVTAADGGATRSAYDAAGNLVSRTDPDGNSYTYAYDADNRLAKVTDPLNNSVYYSYDNNGNQVTFTDARGITTTTAYDADDRPVTIAYSDGTPTVTDGYDADGQLTTVKDGTGSRTMSYDAAGQITKASGLGAGAFSYTYDAAGNIASRSYPDGTQMSYRYDSDGQISALATGAATTTYSYDLAGNLVSTTEPNGVTESRSYDGAGQLTGIKDSSSSTVLDSYGLTLNSDGQPSQVAIVQDGAAQASRYYGYDSTGRLTSACYSSSGSSACGAGSAGAVTGTAPDPAAPGAPSGAVTNGIAGKCLDDSGNSTTAGGKVDIFSCSGGASQVWTVQSDGTIRINGQCLDVKGAGTANGTLIDHYTCVGQANQQWKLGSSHSLVNPVSGMCLSDPNASTTDGTQLIIANCNGQPQQQWLLPSSALAPAGPLSSGLSGKCLDDSGGSSSSGNKIDIYSCNGQASQNWTVDSDGTVRIMGKCLDVKGQGTANSTVVDLYTCVGQGNQVWEPTPNGFLVNPASGKCLDDPGSSTTNGTQLNIYTCVAGASNEVWTLPSTTIPGVPASVKVTAGAAAATATWSLPSATGGSALAGFTVTASPGGATSSVGPYSTTATVAGLTAGTAYSFTVTASNGLGASTSAATTAVVPGNETTYGYDQAGNLTSSQTAGLTTNDTYNADEELTKAVTGSAAVSYGYNADGDRTSTGTQTYTYNGAGELSGLTSPAGSFSYSYDADGNLFATDLNGSLLQGTVWDDNASLPLAAEDTGPTGAGTADYLYGPDGALGSVKSSSGTYDAATDSLDSVTGLINSSGVQVTSTSYDAYGTPSTSVLAANAPVPAIGFAGSAALPGGSGLDDMRARDYDPATGEFTAPDPMLTATSQPYAYADADPVAGIDPSGSVTCPSWVPGCGVVTDLQHGASSVGQQLWQQLLTGSSCASVAGVAPNFDDPSQPPGPGWTWRGPGRPGTSQGSWWNESTKASLHPDLDHPEPIGPHYDYTVRGTDIDIRIYPGQEIPGVPEEPVPPIEEVP